MPVHVNNQIPTFVGAALWLLSGLAFAGADGGSDRASLELFADTGSGSLVVRAPQDGSGRVFVVHLAGIIHVVDRFGVAQPFLDLGADGLQLTDWQNERGLTGLAFHPDFAGNGRFFVKYTDQPGQSSFGTVVAEFAAEASDSDPGGALKVVEPGSHKVLLRIVQDFSNHNGGDLHFGNDGYLYVAMGDGGSPNDPCNRAQDLLPTPETPDDGGGSIGACAAGNDDPTHALLGKLLRLDVNNPGANADTACGPALNYGIPADNPFVEDHPCAEIWAWGLRSPFRFGVDRASGAIVIGDVGQDAVEEVSVALPSEAGLNFGWDCHEGNIPGQVPSPECFEASEPRLPSIVYRHQDGRCSVIGGHVYRGANRAWHGRYIYGDFCSGEIFIDRVPSPALIESPTLLLDAGVDHPEGLCSTRPCLVGFGEDEFGEIYVSAVGGQTYRLLDPEVSFGSGFE